MLKKSLILLLILNIYPNDQCDNKICAEMAPYVIALNNLCKSRIDQVRNEIALVKVLIEHHWFTIPADLFKKVGQSQQEINRLRKILSQMGIRVQKNNKDYVIDIPSYLSQEEEREARITFSLLIEEEEKKVKNKFFGLLALGTWLYGTYNLLGKEYTVLKFCWSLPDLCQLIRSDELPI